VPPRAPDASPFFAQPDRAGSATRRRTTGRGVSVHVAMKKMKKALAAYV